jgi:hypothetical protein
MDKETQRKYNFFLALVKNNKIDVIQELFSRDDTFINGLLHNNNFELFREAAKHQDSLALKILLQKEFNNPYESILESFFTCKEPKASIINLIQTAKVLDIENPSALIVDKVIGNSFFSLLISYLNLTDDTYPEFAAYNDHYDQVKEFFNFTEQLGITSQILCQIDASFGDIISYFAENDIAEFTVAMQRHWDAGKRDKKIQKNLLSWCGNESLIMQVLRPQDLSIIKFILTKAQESDLLKILIDEFLDDELDDVEFTILNDASPEILQLIFDELTLSQINKLKKDLLLRFCRDDRDNNDPENLPVKKSKQTEKFFNKFLKDEGIFNKFLNDPLENAVKRILTLREIHETKETGHILSVLTNLVTEYLYESKPEDKYVFSKEQLARILPHKEAILSGDIRGRVLRCILDGTITITSPVEIKDSESKEEAARSSFESTIAASASASSSSSSSASTSATTGISSSSSSSSTDLLILARASSSASQTAPLIASVAAAHVASSSNVKLVRKEPSSSLDNTQSKRQRVTEQKDSTISTSSSSSSSTSFATRLEGNLAPAPAPSGSSYTDFHTKKLSQEVKGVKDR